MSLQMTPMIDVVFQLLIFFICTSSFQQLEEILPTHLLAQGSSPSTVEVPPPELDTPEPVVVKVQSNQGQTAWNISGRSLATMDEVRQVLEALGGIPAARRKMPVILDVSGDVPLGSVIDLYDLCRVIGFEKIQFAAKVGPEG